MEKTQWSENKVVINFKIYFKVVIVSMLNQIYKL